MEAPSSDAGRPGRVLFVDDDPKVRSAVARSLRKRGYILDLAADGQEALALATAYPYVVVATDHMMPGLSGLELVQRLQVLQPDCSFVMISGSPEQVALLHRVPFVSAVLPKPWDDEHLGQAIDKGVFEAQARVQRRQAPTKPNLPASGKFALLVEDNDTDAFLLEKALQRDDEDYRIVRARNLAEAVRLLAARSYDAIFADLGLPDAQGVAVVRELRTRAPDTPILIVTGDDDDSRALSTLQSGAQDHLIKGRFDRDNLQRATQHAIERKRLERRLSQLAHFDALTGLANRVLLADRVHGALSRAHRAKHSVALLCVDLDRFKDINDQHGHDVGDRLLVEVAQRLCISTRLGDTVARVGGDEFVILLESLHEAREARIVAQRILNSFATPTVIQGKLLPVTPSVGVAFYPTDARDVDELFRRADAALYQAKEDGKNCFRFFSRELQRRETTRQTVERELREAVASVDYRGRATSKPPPFSLAFQGRYDLKAGTLRGYDALLRWSDESGSLRPARDFVTVIEEIGEIERVGSWVINEVCHAAKTGPFDPQHRLSFNASRRELESPSFLPQLETALARHHLPGQHLKVEVGEAVLARPSPEVLATVHRLHELGVAIAVDSFGLEGSSLFGLASLPISTLKLSPLITARLDDEAYARALQALARMAQSMRWSLVATGIETPQQLSRVKEAGCPYGQGRLWGEPSLLPTESLHAFNAR